ncbi:MAG: hypothetical protein H6669_07385 [Ardenticatenaceae bacterium]|nr:hypothetical protein [Ardenticatenaceae bacterium]
MFDLFRGIRDDNERDEGGPRIVFANLRRPSRPILSEQGYAVFSATTFSIWTLLVFTIWVFRIEVSPSQDTVTSIAGSSVELAALSLAVLGILHELNKEDRWFKLGLFLVSIFFACVVFSGFFLSMTWRPEYDDPQQITVFVIAALGVVAAAQFNWKAILKYTRWRWGREITLPGRVTITARYFRLSFPFALPFFLIWFPDLNRLTATIVVFSGALIALVALMGITTISLLRSPKEKEQEDPFISALRARYEDEVKTIIRFGELKAKTVDALSHLQNEHVKAASQAGEAPALVDKSSIIVRLRQMDVTDDERVIENVLAFLVNEGVVCRESYSGPYWIVSDKQTVDNCLTLLQELALVITRKDPDIKAKYTIRGYDFVSLRNWLAFQAKLPQFVVGEYVMPKVLDWLLSPEKYSVETDWRGKLHPDKGTFVFISRSWRSPDYKFQEIEGIMERYRASGYHQKHDTLKALLDKFPHTSDVSLYSLDSIDFDKVVSILLEGSRNTELESG